jgi:nitroreductase
MEALRAILGRRSIRQYTKEPVSEEVVEILLRSAMSAPSANNEQPWHFIVITRRATLDAIPTFHQYAQMCEQAPLAILVCGDESLVKHTGYMIQDCSAATENLLIAAHAMDLGAVWLGIYPREQRMQGIRELLHLPKHILPVALIAIGYPAETKPPIDRYNCDRVHENEWS